MNPRHVTLTEDVVDELFGGDRVRLRLLARRGEGAELALHAADVRLVHVEVLDEVDLVRPSAPAAREVRQLAERQHVVGLENREPVLEVEAVPAFDLLPDAVQGAQLDDGHYFSRSMTMCVSASSSGSSLRKLRALLA